MGQSVLSLISRVTILEPRALDHILAQIFAQIVLAGRPDLTALYYLANLASIQSMPFAPYVPFA